MTDDKQVVAMRAAFESWATRSLDDSIADDLQTRNRMLYKDAQGDYTASAMKNAFHGWQAATLAERERCAKVCESERLDDSNYDSDKAYNFAIRHCTDAILKGDA